jgi:hypothetical protein
MLQFLSVMTLLLEIHLNSAASVNVMMKLDPKESLVRTAGANVSNFASTVTGTLLTGYFSNIHYADRKCTVVDNAQSYKLNTCFPTPEGFSGRVIMNATHWNVNYFTDYSCKVLYSTKLVYYPLRACDNAETVSVTSSYSKIVSSAALLDVMYVTQFPFKYEIFTASF